MMLALRLFGPGGTLRKARFFRAKKKGNLCGASIFCRQWLPAHMVPSGWVTTMDSVPADRAPGARPRWIVFNLRRWARSLFVDGAGKKKRAAGALFFYRERLFTDAEKKKTLLRRKSGGRA